MTRIVVVVAIALAAASGGTAASGGPSPCIGSQLRARVEVQGALGHLVGTVRFFDGGSACTVRGRPIVMLESTDGRRLPVNRGTLEPLWKSSRERAPRGWPLVTTRPGKPAMTLIEIGNWCGRHDERIRLVFQLGRGRGAVRAPVEMGIGCLAPKSPVGLSIGPFEPLR
jgi:hypothetical protein